MTPRLLAAALLVCAAPVSAQLETPQNALGRLLDHPPRVLIVPGYTLVAGAPDERTLSTRIRWPADSARTAALVLLGHIVSAGRDVYSQSGVEGQLRMDAGRIDFTGTARIAAGRGAGPAQAFAVTVNAGIPAATIEFRTTWLRERDADPRLPAEDELAPVVGERGYTDGELHSRVNVRSATLRVTGGVRFGELRQGPAQWVWAEAEHPVWRRFSLVASGGVRPYRPELAQHGGGFALLGIRLDTGPDDNTYPAIAPTPRADPQPVLVMPLAPNRYLLRVMITGARRVQLNGDVTDWQPLRMNAVPGTPNAWDIVLVRPAGVYYVNVRVDDGDWVVPPGLVAVPDRFGGAAGLLTLPLMEEVRNAAH